MRQGIRDAGNRPSCHPVSRSKLALAVAAARSSTVGTHTVPAFRGESAVTYEDGLAFIAVAVLTNEIIWLSAGP
jgi:hypothetical protein